ncbi:globin-like protein [Nadsonia fulvescens var. elongata DSM 6958]|uniref:Globin-like protein n=1 Tax=Nadsonia fulvescens var. elongata DSM 6958 TaxID=857566 RepID=A0A1E3PPV8_9ASCO|nr:globin-like protein [Nadsonia fulvescens var. elongata DSM 6958]
MNAAEIVILKSSWQELYSNSATTLFIEQFYDNLISQNPDILILFPSIRRQSVAFAGVLSLAISSLDNIEVLDDYLVRLGKRHGRIIGVDVSHFEMVGNALLDTLRDKLGDGMTIELESAWIRLYSYLANKLLDASEDDYKPVKVEIAAPIVPVSNASSLNAKSPMTLGIQGSSGLKLPANGSSPINSNFNSSVASLNPASEKRKPPTMSSSSMLQDTPSYSTPSFTNSNSGNVTSSSTPANQFNIKQRKRKADTSKNKECSIM